MFRQKLLINTLPRFCVFCQVRCVGCDCCQACWQALRRLAQYCRYCGEALLGVATDDAVCGRCLQQQAPHYQRLYIPLVYEAPLSRLIQGLKFQGKLAYADVLAALLADYLVTRYEADSWPDVLIPMPLHAGRLRQRGFNQALLIAKGLHKRLQIPIDTHSTARIKATAPQAELSGKARRHNVTQAFQLQKPIPKKHIAIIDDVFTTGQTVVEFAKIFHQSSIERIDVWCCAKTTLTTE